LIEKPKAPGALSLMNKCALSDSACQQVVLKSCNPLMYRHGRVRDFPLACAILASLSANGVDDSSLLITNARHYDLLCSTQREIEAARDALRERHSEELVLVPLHNALKFLGQITGETTTEDILSEIFATFCIGK
jgi:tRNA U34 5-carboxymethylaminomethyl modifying GTPase MnmE/TrmE